nr:unnamed protein product [Sorex araneus]
MAGPDGLNPVLCSPVKRGWVRGAPRGGPARVARTKGPFSSPGRLEPRTCRPPGGRQGAPSDQTQPAAGPARVPPASPSRGPRATALRAACSGLGAPGSPEGGGQCDSGPRGLTRPGCEPGPGRPDPTAPPDPCYPSRTPVTSGGPHRPAGPPLTLEDPLYPGRTPTTLTAPGGPPSLREGQTPITPSWIPPPRPDPQHSGPDPHQPERIPITLTVLDPHHPDRTCPRSPRPGRTTVAPASSPSPG